MASGEKMDDVALIAAHNSLLFGTKVLIENIGRRGGCAPNRSVETHSAN
jgi:hypothetical protein